MANERLTEDIVRTHFREYPLFKSIRLEEQRLYSRRVSRLLKSAFKTGGKGPGLPELLIQKAIELNEEYNNYSINETMRNTMVSAILLALINKPFRASFEMEPTIQSLSSAMMHAIDTTLTAGRVRNKAAIIGEFAKITNDPLFVQFFSVRSSARRNTATTTDASGTRRRCMNPSFGCPLARARRIGSGWSTS